MSDNKYDDIINLPYRKSHTRNHMSVKDRAAQFSPFAALVGHGDAIRETARLTDGKIELDEYQKAEINRSLRYIQENPRLKNDVTITYFKPDTRKDGGEYITMHGGVKKIKKYEQKLVLDDGTEISIDNILSIQ